MGPIEPTEPLARYIFQRRHYSPSDKRVNYRAFMPAPNNRETSVYRISGLNDTDIWRMGNSFVATVRGRPLLGRADILTSNVLNNGLEVQPAPGPHPRHANITNWPEECSEQKLVAIKLAEMAQLHLTDN